MRRLAIPVAFVGLVVGGSAFAMGWITSKDALLQQGTAVLVASLALVGVAAGLSTWRDQRIATREEKQRDAYAALVFQLLMRFAGSGRWDPAGEAKLRAEVVTWGHPDVVRALNSWLRRFDEVVAVESNAGVVTLGQEQQETMRKATAQVAAAVREHLALPSSPSIEEIEGALFNYPSS
jgi:hypothetical protein